MRLSTAFTSVHGTIYWQTALAKSGELRAKAFSFACNNGTNGYCGEKNRTD